MNDTERERINAICEVAGVAEIDDLSDGYHTFRQLYYQRMMLFAAIVRQNKDKAWKSLRHEDGDLCFGGGWFIVGIDTPEGSYTYHYENKYFDLFDCEILDYGKHWDGHTEKDVTRLLSLPKTQLSQEGTTSDLIDRQQAIDGLDGHYIERRNLNDWQAGWNAALDWMGSTYLDEFPSAQPEQQWIPCSERLPNCNGCYLVWRPHFFGGEMGMPAICYFDGQNTWHDSYGVDFERVLSSDDVTAWMPLPKPYKAENEPQESEDKE